MYDNCFAKNGDKCRALTDMLCTKGKCPFYKSKQKYEADMKKYPPLKDIGGR